VKINTDSNLRAGSQIVLSGESTFTLAAGKTLTLETGASISLLAALPNDTGITDPPVKIYGTLVVAEDATVTIPALTAFTIVGDISSVISFGSTGKLQVQKGGIVNTGTGPTVYVDDTGTPVYTLANTGDTIEFSEHHRKITGATVALSGDDAIPKNDTLEIAAGAVLTIAATKKLTLNAEQTAGAALIGPGTLKAHNTEIVGGIYGGWQATSGSGAATVEIAAASDGSSITASAATVSLVAKGPGAVITQVGGVTNALTITASALSTDGVINLGLDGRLVLKGTTSTAPGIILLANGMIKIGTGVGTGNVDNADLIVTNATFAANLTGKAAEAKNPSVLTQIIGNASDNTITGTTTEGDDVIITANIPADGS
jgi:hypothetical protein